MAKRKDTKELRIPVGIAVRRELLERFDAVIGERSRSRVVEHLIESYVRRCENKREIRKGD